MGTRIIKAARETDLYMEWSGELQIPLFLGTRIDLGEYLSEPKWHCARAIFPDSERVKKRLARADEVGDSVIDFPWPFDTTDGLIFEGRHVLRRTHAEEFMRAFVDNDGKDRDELGGQWQRLLNLLEPLADSSMAHRRER